MKRFIKSKKGVGLIAAVAALAVAGGALAYVTTGGSGAGSAPDGSTTNNLVIGTGTNAANPVSVASNLVPGASVAVSYSIYNPNSFGVKVSTVSDSSITQSNSTCNATPLNGDFSYTDGGAANGITIPAGATSGPYTGTLTETDDTANNQDSCLGESPYDNSTTLSLVSN